MFYISKLDWNNFRKSFSLRLVAKFISNLIFDIFA
jgi:hypothetical protein